MARHIVIVGGGAAGALTAIQLARRASLETHLTVVEPRRRLGEGVAYGTSDSAHLLNVPANGMSAHDDDPDHFVRWATCTPGDFVARHRYAEYLSSELNARVTANPDLRYNHLRDTAICVDAAHPTSSAAWHVTTTSGEILNADAVVLALGNAAPSRPEWLRTFTTAPVIEDPWTTGALDGLDAGTNVLCVGTGLTFVDVALSLARHGARVTGVSRHGLIPEVHAPIGPTPDVPASLSSPAQVMRWIRTQSDWRSAFAALRPKTSFVWRSFSPAQQAQFLRLARRHWDVHRHRMASGVATELQRLRDAGVVDVRRGDAQALATSGAYDVVVLCTGPDDAALRDTPPLSGLVASGTACAGPHGMGIATDADTGNLIDARSRSVEGLFAIGTLRRGTLWESTAVPEIRAEAHCLAALLLA